MPNIKKIISELIINSFATLFPRKPLISICILTRNRPKFLEMCLDNVLKNLYYDNVEILIMADGFNSTTEKVLQKHVGNNKIKIFRNKKHIGLNAFKQLFRKAKGHYLIQIDDDAIEFPSRFDQIIVEYMNLFSDYGFVALNVIQNEFTNGSKLDDSHFTEDIRGEKIIQYGPAGGWCACFRRSDFKKIRILFNLNNLSMRKDQIQVLSGLVEKYLKLKRGIIKNVVCFHASGPYYAKQFGYLESEIEKYEENGLPSFVENYKSFLD